MESVNAPTKSLARRSRNQIRDIAQRRQGHTLSFRPKGEIFLRSLEIELETRNPKFETNPNDEKTQIPNNLVLDFGFEGLGLFRISSFGFRILLIR